MHFTKMHGCGNDYLFVDAWRDAAPDDPPASARRWCDRHRGVGGDGLIVIGPAEDGDVAAAMRMWNADGSEAEMCGNGLRCAARLAADRGHLDGGTGRIATGAGPLAVRVEGDRVRVAMGPPRLDPPGIPVDLPSGDRPLRLEVDAGNRRLRLIAIGMGNPHAVHFCDHAESLPLERLGPAVERHPRFPRRTNFEIAAPLDPDGDRPRWRQRTWERGSGITLACGTGACAVVVAAILDGRQQPGIADVELDGGTLAVRWDGGDSEVELEGEAVYVFEGTVSGG